MSRRGRSPALGKGGSAQLKFKCLKINSRTVAVQEEASKMSSYICSLQKGCYVPTDGEKLVDGILWYHLPCGWLCSMDSNGYEATVAATDTEGQKQWAAEFDKRRRVASAICAMLTRSYSLENGRRVANSIVKHINSGKMGPLMNLPDISMEDLMVGLSSAVGLRQRETLDLIKIAACQQCNPPKALRDIANEVLELISMRPSLWITTDRNVLETMDVRSRNDQFIMSAARGDTEMFEKFLAIGQELVAVHSELKYTALHAAADFGQDDIARRLIRTGMSTDIRDARKGQTPLHLAGQGGRSNIATLLLQAGADRTIKSYTGVLPFHLAVDQGFLECAEILKFAPPAVQYVTVAAVTTKSLSLRWDVPAMDTTICSKISGYVVEWTPVGNPLEVGHGERFHVSSNSFKLRHLRPATGHGFVIYCSSLGGLAPGSSKIIQFTKPSPPDPPPTVEMLRVSINGIFLNWLPPKYNNGAKLDRYQLELVDCDQGAGIEAAERAAEEAVLAKQEAARLKRMAKKLTGMTLGGRLEETSVVGGVGRGMGGDEEEEEEREREEESLYSEAAKTAADEDDDDRDRDRDYDYDDGEDDGALSPNHGGSVSSSLADMGSVAKPVKEGGGNDINHRIFKVSASTVSKQCMGLEPWKPYQCRVRCHNNLGYSPWSQWIGPITPQPGVYVLEFDRENRSVRVGWFKPMLSGTRRVTDFDVQLCNIEGPLEATLPIFADKADKAYLISKNQSYQWKSISPPGKGLTINELVVSELKAGSKYQVRVRTQVDGQWLDWTLALYSDIILMPACAPEKPMELRVATKDIGGPGGAGATRARAVHENHDGQGGGEGQGLQSVLADEGDADWVKSSLGVASRRGSDSKSGGDTDTASSPSATSNTTTTAAAAAAATTTTTVTSSSLSSSSQSPPLQHGHGHGHGHEQDGVATTDPDTLELAHDSIGLCWQNGINNGSPVCEYRLEMCKVREYRSSDMGLAMVAAGVGVLTQEEVGALGAISEGTAAAAVAVGGGGGGESVEEGEGEGEGEDTDEDVEDEEPEVDEGKDDDWNSPDYIKIAPASDEAYYKQKRRLEERRAARKAAKRKAAAEAKAAAAAAVADGEGEWEGEGGPKKQGLRWQALGPDRAALRGPQSFHVSGLSPGCSYIFRLRVRNEHGWSPWSLASAVITTFPCLPVQTPEALKCGPYSAYARWNEQGDARFMGMTNLEFQVHIGKIPTGESQRTCWIDWELADSSLAPAEFAKPRINDPPGSKFVAVLLDNLSPATDFCVRVRVRTILGWSTWSEVSATFRTLAAPA